VWLICADVPSGPGVLMSGEVAFIYNLVSLFPQLRGAFSAHLYNNNRALLLHVFFGCDVVHEMMSSYTGDADDSLDWHGLIKFLDEQYVIGDKNVRRLL
jgi:hypothetical protein